MSLEERTDDAGAYLTSSDLEELSTRFPVDRTLGWLDLLLRHDLLPAYYGAKVFGISPAHNTETEAVFGNIARDASKHRRWVGYDLGWTREDLVIFDFEKRFLANKAHWSDFQNGIASAVEAGLIAIEYYNGRVCAIPTEKFARYVSETLHRHSSQMLNFGLKPELAPR